MLSLSHCGWSNQPPISKTYVHIFSPPVCQLSHVGNRLLHPILLCLAHVFTSFSCAAVFWSHHGSSLRVCSPLRLEAILMFTLHPLKSFQLYISLPSCHLCSLGLSEPRSAILLRSAHLELHLLLSDLLQLHLQRNPFPQSSSTVTWEVFLEPANPSLSSLLSANSPVSSHDSVHLALQSCVLHSL